MPKVGTLKRITCLGKIKKAMRKVCRRYGLSAHETEDYMQAELQKLLEKIESLNNLHVVQQWCAKGVENMIIDEFRKEIQTVDIDSIEVPYEANTESIIDLKRRIEALPRNQRDCIERGYSIKESALYLGRSVDFVEDLWKRIKYAA